MSFNDIQEIGQTVLEGMEEARMEILSSLRTPTPYIAGAVGILVGVIMSSLTSRSSNRTDITE
jgi:hypothetical protein